MKGIKIKDVFDMIKLEFSRHKTPIYEIQNVEHLLRIKNYDSCSYAFADIVAQALYFYYDEEEFHEKLDKLKLETNDAKLLEEYFKNSDIYDMKTSENHRFLLLAMYYFEDTILDYCFAKFLRKPRKNDPEEDKVNYNGKEYVCLEQHDKSMDKGLIKNCLEIFWVTSGHPTNVVPKLVYNTSCIGFNFQTRNHGNQTFVFPSWYIKRTTCKYAIICWLCLYKRRSENYCLSRLNRDIFIKISRIIWDSRREGCWSPIYKIRMRKKSRIEDD